MISDHYSFGLFFFMKEKRLGLLVLSIGNFGNKGFYNLQEVGLAKALSKYFKEVLVYRLVSSNQKKNVEIINSNTKFYSLPSKKIGSNGIPKLSDLDNSIDILVCFSDTQIMFPRIYRWCNNNNIRIFPYVGVTRSNSHNIFIRKIIDLFYYRNLSIYKKLFCFAKTPYVLSCLKKTGVNYVTLAPIGLDFDNLNTDFDGFNSEKLKKEFGFDNLSKIILFVGRLTTEKKPLELLEYFKKIYSSNACYRLVMLGSGELKEQIKIKISDLNLEHFVKLIDKIPNQEMWKYYKLADCFVNLNTHEIFGMAILEALFYDCKVVAWSAPGPDYIIKNGVSGWIVNSDRDFIEKILDSRKFNTNRFILKHFTWEKTASSIVNMINSTFFAV